MCFTTATIPPEVAHDHRTAEASASTVRPLHALLDGGGALTKPHIRDLIARARDIAEALTRQVPRASVYPLVSKMLDDTETKLAVSARRACDAARDLGVLAVRELDGAEGAAGELASLCFEIRDAARRACGLPYWE